MRRSGEWDLNPRALVPKTSEIDRTPLPPVNFVTYGGVEPPLNVPKTFVITDIRIGNLCGGYRI